MPKRRTYTRELLTARTNAYEAYLAHRGEEPMLRIVAGHSGGTPVAYQPRNPRDPRPWVEYNGATGEELFRYTGRECWTVPVDTHSEIIPSQTVARSVYLRLAAEGIACEAWCDSAGTHARYTFADQSEVTWAGTDLYGTECSNLHPIGEHGSLQGHWMQNEQPPYEEDLRDFATGTYAADSAALVAWMVSLADRHGRTWQKYASPRDDAAAFTWQQRTGGVIAADTDGMRRLVFDVDGQDVPGGRASERWHAIYSVPAVIDPSMTQNEARQFGTPAFERAPAAA
ncbi:hypothetical protein [Streptomyces sp. 7N604]|uniref:hypothetical protein n=1 Tax=Streptomyces sp. 7N604 TaxID=3457415 RepID=UPI003FD5B311